MYLDFLLVEGNAVDDVETRLLVGLGIRVIRLLEDHLILCTKPIGTIVSLLVIFKLSLVLNRASSRRGAGGFGRCVWTTTPPKRRR